MSKNGSENSKAEAGGAPEIQDIPAQDQGSENLSPVFEDLSSPDESGGWEQKYAEMNDQYLRKAADFENYRKRMNREKQELTEFANQSLILDLIPVIDDFERAIKSAETSKDFASFYEGVIMIEKRLITELENKWGLKRFNSAGEPFDPMRHEALHMEKAAGIAEPMVKEDFLKGYSMKDRVIRFAKVKVLMPEESKEQITENK
jgi:molecular chaperone GrpE